MRPTALGAELIRLQCRMYRIDYEDPERAVLGRRAEELVTQYRPIWFGPLERVATWKSPGLLVANYPVPGTESRWKSCLIRSLWAWVEELRPWHASNQDKLRTVLASPCLATVRSLDLSRNHIGPRGAAFLAASPAVGCLRELNLGWVENVGDEGARALAASPHLARLCKLDLAVNKIGPKGAAALANSPHLAGLTRLLLGANPLGGRGVAALAASPYLKRLTTLGLYSTDFGPQGAGRWRLLPSWQA